MLSLDQLKVKLFDPAATPEDRTHTLLMFGRAYVNQIDSASNRTSIEPISLFMAQDHGLSCAHLFMREADPQKKIPILQEAIGQYIPILASRHNCPQASLNIGILADLWAWHALQNTKIPVEDRVRTANAFFIEAAEYYAMAAKMPDIDNEKHPQMAANSLGRLHMLGAGVEKNEAKAFALFLQAAENGWWEARINTAVSYYIGRGTGKSLEQAVAWMGKAQIPDDHVLKHEAEEFLKRIKSELSNEPERPGDVPETLQNLAIKPPSL